MESRKGRKSSRDVAQSRNKGNRTLKLVFRQAEGTGVILEQQEQKNS